MFTNGLTKGDLFILFFLYALKWCLSIEQHLSIAALNNNIVNNKTRWTGGESRSQLCSTQTMLVGETIPTFLTVQCGSLEGTTSPFF